MKRLKYILIGLLCLVGLVGLTIALSVTIFKDELIEFVVNQKQKKYKNFKAYYVAEIPVEPASFAEDFRSIHSLILENCSLYKHKNYDIDSLYTAFASRIGTDVKTKADYGLLVCEYIAALNIGHANALLDVYWAKHFPVSVEGRIFIEKPSEYLANYGFRDKDEIIAINHTPTDEYVNSRMRYTHASTHQARLHLTRRWLLRSHTDSLISCDVLRENDTLTLELPLTRVAADRGNEPLARGKMLNDRVGYISIESMMDNVVEQFVQAYEQVCHLPYLIIDVRQNGGGNSGNGRLIAEYLVRNPQIHCVGGDITPQPNAYKGKLFLLTSNYTFSAAESFTIDLKESGNATLVGEPTAGDTGNAPDIFMSKYGISLRLPTRAPKVSPKGFPMEGVGIEPHYEVRQSMEDYFNDKDSAIEFVLNNLCQ